MVVLLNPAFQATRYAPIHRILASQSESWRRYSAPLLVLITAQSDWATRIAFQFGRFANSLLESELGQEEHDINLKTPGHVLDYVTHWLTRTDGAIEPCRGWISTENIQAPKELLEQTIKNLEVELMQRDEFMTANKDGAGKIALRKEWSRTFCGGGILKHEKLSPNAPIWNVRVTDSSIINGHNDISQPILTNLLRQLYVDSVQYPSK